jgi:hypothetical protein
MLEPFRKTAGRISLTKQWEIKLSEGGITTKHVGEGILAVSNINTLGQDLDLVHEFPGQIVNRKLRRQSQAKKLN